MRIASHPFIFSRALERAVVMLRNGGLVGNSEFPKLLSPIVLDDSSGKSAKFLVKIQVREDFSPRELWLRFNRCASSVYISPDTKEWISITKFKV